MIWYLELLLALAKSLFLIALGMGVGVLLTWADRRQGAMIQDRVGPNRAVVFLPGRLAALLMLLPALVLAAGLMVGAFWLGQSSEARHLGGLIALHLAVAAIWVTALVIGGRVRVRGARNSLDLALLRLGNPRRFVLIGILVHLLLGFATGSGLDGAMAAAVAEFGFRSGPAVTALMIVIGASYAASHAAKQPRVGLRLAGLLHPAADGIKSIWKEDIVPSSVDRLMHGLAPFISFFPSLVVMAVVPFGPPVHLGPELQLERLLEPLTSEPGAPTVLLQLLDVEVGILFFFALAGTGIVGAALAGWASNSKYSLLGALRASSQMISYEVALGLSLVGVLLFTGSLRLDAMVVWQAEHAWGLFVQPLGFILFFAAAVAETKRIPFDLPEGESEIVAGYFTEYSGMKFAMFFFAEYIAIVSSSALMVTLFLGGWHLPFVTADGIRVAFGGESWFEVALPHGAVVVLGVLSFLGKTVLLCWFQLLVRWTLPRFRYDQLMNLGWTRLLPLSVVNVLISAVVVLIATGLSEETVASLKTLGALTELAVVVGAVILVGYLGARLFEPARHRRLVVTSSARIAEKLGGTPASSMGA